MWRRWPSLLAMLVGGSLSAQTPPDWKEPVPPFRIAGNVYYVGTKDLASYLITTPQGHILINSTLEENVPLIKRSVEQLGFRFTDIRVLLISHAHWDHAAGSASVKRLTGAKYFVMDGDVDVVESGGNTDFQYGDQPSTLYPPTKVDRVLHDGDEVTIGDALLVAHLTPGHTRGCTTWTMKVQEGGRTYDMVIIGSPNVNPGYQLVNNRSYPEIAADYERTFRVLKSLPCDIFLGAHGSYFDLATKYARLTQGARMPFVDQRGCKNYITEREEAFRSALEQQRAASPRRRLQNRRKRAGKSRQDVFAVERAVGCDNRFASVLPIDACYAPRRIHHPHQACAGGKPVGDLGEDLAGAIIG